MSSSRIESSNIVIGLGIDDIIASDFQSSITVDSKQWKSNYWLNQVNKYCASVIDAGIHF